VYVSLYEAACCAAVLPEAACCPALRPRDTLTPPPPSSNPRAIQQEEVLAGGTCSKPPPRIPTASAAVLPRTSDGGGNPVDNPAAIASAETPNPAFLPMPEAEAGRCVSSAGCAPPSGVAFASLKQRHISSAGGSSSGVVTPVASPMARASGPTGSGAFFAPATGALSKLGSTVASMVTAQPEPPPGKDQ